MSTTLSDLLFDLREAARKAHAGAEEALAELRHDAARLGVGGPLERRFQDLAYALDDAREAGLNLAAVASARRSDLHE